MTTKTKRQQLLATAAEAVRALLGHNPDTDEPLVEPTKVGADHHPVYRRLGKDAQRAVTAAVVEGEHLHTQIATMVMRRNAGLIIAQLVNDPDAQAEALVRERHAAERYAAEVRFAIRTAAVAAALSGDRGAKLAAAARYKVSRVTLDRWLKEEADGTAPQTPWDDMRPDGEAVA